MIASIFLNVILLVFPLVCYFVYVIYSKVNIEKENALFLDLALFSSFYLCSKYSEINLFSIMLLNILILLCIFKRRYYSLIMLSISISFLISVTYDVNIIIFLVGYLLLFLLIEKLNKYGYYIFSSLTTSFLIIIYFYSNNLILNSLIILILLTFILSLLIYFLVQKISISSDEMIELNKTLDKIKKEKILYESLFKITDEIKNPLAVCKGYLDMFDVNKPDKASKYINVISQEINRTLILLKDFSEVSKSINIEKKKIDINLLVEDVCEEMKFIFNKDIKFNYKIIDKEIYIDGDYNRLKQVLINVIKNAKESIEGKGKISLEAKNKINKYLITIKDTGCGMDEKTLNSIGRAFYTTKKDGTGLGVCFSKEIIAKHDGTINYFSKLDEGTTVKITLPIKK